MAVRTWKGYAVAQTQVSTITVGGTWATSDTPTFTINGKDVVVTVGATSTVAAVAQAMAEAVNGDAIGGDNTYLPDGGGSIIPEFAGITASYTSTTVVLTADVAGRPFTVTATDNSASGTFSAVAATVACTGPSFWDDIDNWSEDDTPDDNDNMVFDSGNVNCLYALDQNGVTPDEMNFTQGYSGKIGLPPINNLDSNNPYDEYLDQYLKLCDSGDSPTSSFTFVKIGEGEGTGSQRLKLDFNTGPVDVTVFNTGTREDGNVPPVLLKGAGNTSVLRVFRGDVGVGFYEGEAAEFDAIQVGYINAQESDAKLYLGEAVTLSGCALAINGGVTTINSTTSSGTIVQFAGTLNIRSAAHASITLHGGQINDSSAGTITTLVIGNDGVYYAPKSGSKTITNLTMYKGAKLFDPFGVLTITNGIDFYECGPEDVTLELGKHFTLTKSSI